jgi:hypothetical protein
MEQAFAPKGVAGEEYSRGEAESERQQGGERRLVERESESLQRDLEV